MISLAVVVAACSLGVGVLCAFLLRAAPTVWLQLAGLALLSASVPLAAVLASGWVMFHMGDDVKILAIASGSAFAAVLASLLLARWIARSLQLVGAASARVAGGEFGARVPSTRPAELAQLAHAFNLMAESVESLFDARRELVAWASHDLRSPIASMQAMLEAIEDGVASVDDYLPSLHEQVATLTVLVDDLFQLAQIDAGVLALELQPTDLAEVARSAVRLLEPSAARRQVTLSAPGGVAVVVPAEAEKIQRVLVNLLSNALRHTPPRGRVSVAVSAEGGSVTVSVDDTGEGLEGDAAQRMFDRFWRADRARGAGGSGPRARDRARARRGARRPHLGREPHRRRRPRRLHAAGRLIACNRLLLARWAPRRARSAAAEPLRPLFVTVCYKPGPALGGRGAGTIGDICYSTIVQL